jgi:predicted Zn-dependent protease
MDATATVAPGTLAEALGLTAELAEAIVEVALRELEAGRPDPARVILEGLVVSNPQDWSAWGLLARAHRALGQPLAARFCAEVAASLEPDEPAVRLSRAEGLLACPQDRTRARALLVELAGSAGEEGGRARALLRALPEEPG